MTVAWLFISVPMVCLQFVIELFPDQTQYLCVFCSCFFISHFVFNALCRLLCICVCCYRIHGNIGSVY